jgi:hypothetical protein
MEDYVETETAGARKRVEYAEAVLEQEQDDMTYDEIMGLMAHSPKGRLRRPRLDLETT